MGTATTRLTRQLTTRFRGTGANGPLLARSDAGSARRAAVTTLVLVITGGLEYLVDELRLTRNRLRLPPSDEAGYTTTTLILVALVVVILFAAFVVLWMTVISKAIHTRTSCHPGRPCG
jgi:hypothetical protein